MFLRITKDRASRVCLHWWFAPVPLFVALSLSPCACWGQSDTRKSIAVRSKSDLVSVPVFVFQHHSKIARLTVAQRQCLLAASNAFAALPAAQPYQPTDCGIAEIQGLTARDFRLFQDGLEQKIRLVIPEAWQTPVRDNMSWHAATSDTPSGIWSTTDLRAGDLPVKFWPQMYAHFYNLTYVPRGSPAGCHHIKVKVDRPGVQVFARDEYCAGQSPSDILSGTKRGQILRQYLDSRAPGKIPLSLQAAAFRLTPHGARVDVCVWFPWRLLHHSWDDYRLRARIAILGEVRAADGTVAARFSDLLYPPYWPTFIGGAGQPGDSGPPAEEWDPAWLPTRYETQMDLAPGKYDVTVALGDDRAFGRGETRLNIASPAPARLAISSVILCKRFRDAHVAALEEAAANFAPQYVPLASKGTRLNPAGRTTFFEGESLIAFFELYEPVLSSGGRSAVQARIRILDAKTEAVVRDLGPVHTASYERAGRSSIPIARQIPFADLRPGAYRVEVLATGSSRRSTVGRSVAFSISSAADP